MNPNQRATSSPGANLDGAAGPEGASPTDGASTSSPGANWDGVAGPEGASPTDGASTSSPGANLDGAAGPEGASKWSQRVTEQSNALDLEPGVFTFDDPRRIAASLKRSAEQSNRRKADPFRSAMSMLTFYINRAGNKLEAARREHLEEAKDELRELFGKPRRNPRGQRK